MYKDKELSGHQMLSLIGFEIMTDNIRECPLRYVRGIPNELERIDNPVIESITFHSDGFIGIDARFFGNEFEAVIKKYLEIKEEHKND